MAFPPLTLSYHETPCSVPPREVAPMPAVAPTSITIKYIEQTNAAWRAPQTNFKTFEDAGFEVLSKTNEQTRNELLAIIRQPLLMNEVLKIAQSLGKEYKDGWAKRTEEEANNISELRNELALYESGSIPRDKRYLEILRELDKLDIQHLLEINFSNYREQISNLAAEFSNPRLQGLLYASLLVLINLLARGYGQGMNDISFARYSYIQTYGPNALNLVLPLAYNKPIKNKNLQEFVQGLLTTFSCADYKKCEPKPIADAAKYPGLDTAQPKVPPVNEGLTNTEIGLIVGASTLVVGVVCLCTLTDVCKAEEKNKAQPRGLGFAPDRPNNVGNDPKGY